MAAHLARPSCAPGPLGRLRTPMLLLAVLAPLLAAPAGAEEAGQPEAPAPAAPPEVLRVEPVVVTATRTPQRLADVPASVTVLTKEDIAQSPAQTVDDLLRQVPGFSLFRRSSSLVTHPTTQGVSLRGIGPSGASRISDPISLDIVLTKWMMVTKEVGHGRKATEARTCEQ